jgi:glutaredoxin
LRVISRIEIAVVEVFDQMRASCSQSADRRPVAVMARHFFALILSLLAVPWALADEPAQPVPEASVLEVFVRDGCLHCADAKEFLPAFASERPWLQIVYRSVDRDKTALYDLQRHSRDSGNWPPGVPTFIFNGQVLVGFESPQRTGPKLAALVEGLPAIPGSIETGLFGTLSVSNLGLPLFTLAVGLLDGFNPCAMWVLLFLLSMLVRLKDRMRMLLIAGTFVLVGGAVYYAFLAAWLNIFLVMGMSTFLRLALGSVALVIGAINVKDFLVPMQGFSLSIPATAKPGLYARMRTVVRDDSLFLSLSAVVVLAVVVNFIELLCTAGFPAMYTAILAQQDLSRAAYFSYLGLYILGYIADDSLMVATAVLALSSNKLTERAGRWLKLLSGAVMLVLGGVMLLYPKLLL